MSTAAELGLAFGLVLAAGAATAVGAASVFFTNQANHKFLAASLGVSAGVMLYVSFMEIFAAKSVQGFEDAGYTAAEATRYATLSFFAGMVLLWLLDKLVHGILHLIGGKGAHAHAHGHVPTTICCGDKNAPMLVTLQQATQPKASGKGAPVPLSDAPAGKPHALKTLPSSATTTAATDAATTGGAAPGGNHAALTAAVGGSAVALEEIRAPSVTSGNITIGSLVHRHPFQQQQHGAVVVLPAGGGGPGGPSSAYCMVPEHELTGAEAAAHVVLRMHEATTAGRRGPEDGMGRASHVASTTVAVLTEEVAAVQDQAGDEDGAPAGGAEANTLAGEEGGAAAAKAGAGRDDDAASNVSMLEKHHKEKHAKLSRMGLLAALAIGLHNLPEGLATFVGALADPTAGVVIAIAIALHNIPEGVVVAMPIAFASGSKWKGFFWGCLSGATEPIGALVGFAILGGGTNDLNPLVYALLFGLVAGMMVWISVSELLPTAFRYDPDDNVTTWSVAAGMVVMAASLLLFEVK